MKTIIECLPVIGASRADVENWMSRIEFRTVFQKTVPGRARLYTKENVLELAGTAAFVEIGFSPRVAAAYGHMLVRNAAANSLSEWFVCKAGSTGEGRGADKIENIDFDELTSDAGELPILRVVRMGEIARRVDTLFSMVPSEV